MRITVRYFAADAAAANTDSVVVDVPDTATMSDLEDLLGRGHPDLAKVLARCSYLRDSVAVRDKQTRLAPCTAIDVLPPFAGG